MPDESTIPTSRQLNLRLTAVQYELVARAADGRFLNITEFARAAIVAEAERVARARAAS